MHIINLISGCLVVILGIVIYGLPKSLVRMTAGLAPDVFFYKPNSKNQIALTFDDVPFGYEKQLMEKLDFNGIVATHFVISGDVTDESRKTLVQAVKKGHQLGNHGRTNSIHILKSNDDLRQEIIHCDTLIRSIYQEAGVPLPSVMFYRPGSGYFGPQMIRIAKELGYKIALGSVYPHDPFVRYAFINYYYIISRMVAGDIIILHDREWTIPLVNKLIPHIRSQRLTCTTLDKLYTQ